MDKCCENYELHFKEGIDPVIVCANCGFVIDTDGLLIDWHGKKKMAEFRSKKEVIYPKTKTTGKVLRKPTLVEKAKLRFRRG